MNHNEKKEILKNLSEKEFRQDLIIPLLSKMGYIAPIEYHGTNERGKDIICFEYDKLGEQRFLSVVAKTGDLTGDAATDKGLMNVVNQVQQAFDNPYEDLFNMKQVFINEVWIMTTGRIISGAEESVIRTLRKTNLDKQIRFIRDDRLIQLTDNHFGTYWNSSTETKESVIIQRDRLLNFIENILQSNNVDKGTIESVKATILYSDFTPSIRKNIEGLNISKVSPYSIELSKIDNEYDDYLYSKSSGVIKEIFAESKKYLGQSFYYIEETIEHAERISKLTNPEEFVEEVYSHLVQEYPFHQAYGDASKFLDNVSYLTEGLSDLKYFKKYLAYKGKLEWAKELSKSIPKLLPEIGKILDNCKEDEVKINYSISEDNQRVIIEFNDKSESICFSTKFQLIDKESFYNRDKEGKIKATYIIESALAKFREYLENTLNYNEKEWLQNYVD